MWADLALSVGGFSSVVGRFSSVVGGFISVSSVVALKLHKLETRV